MLCHRRLLLDAQDAQQLARVLAARPPLDVSRLVARAHTLHSRTPLYARVGPSSLMPLAACPQSTPTEAVDVGGATRTALLSSAANSGSYRCIIPHPVGSVEVAAAARQRIQEAEDALLRRREVRTVLIGAAASAPWMGALSTSINRGTVLCCSAQHDIQSHGILVHPSQVTLSRMPAGTRANSLRSWLLSWSSAAARLHIVQPRSQRSEHSWPRWMGSVGQRSAHWRTPLQLPMHAWMTEPKNRSCAMHAWSSTLSRHVNSRIAHLNAHAWSSRSLEWSQQRGGLQAL